MHRSVVMSKKQIWFQWSDLEFSAKMEKSNFFFDKICQEGYLDVYLQDFEKESGMS